MLRIFAVIVIAVGVLVPRPADACGNTVERVVRVDPEAKSVRRAERLLADRAHRAVAKEVLATFPQALRAEHRDRRQGLFERSQRALALAVVRSDGALNLGAALPGRTAAQRQAGLAWAAAILRVHHAKGGGVLVTSELAEALARLPAERAAARELLAELGDGDLLPTARAWALLARLEREFGDEAAAGRATRRCREIVPDGDTCGVAAA